MIEPVRESVGERPDDHLIDLSRLESQAEVFRAAFSSAAPWRHVVIENLLRADVATRAAAVYPRIGKAMKWLAVLLEARSYDERVTQHAPYLAAIFEELHGRRFTEFIERVTGIGPLEADRQQVGAGVHQGTRGSYLRVHADHNTHPMDNTRFRRVNVMVYLNKEWRPEWNGDLELWDRSAQACRKRIAPLFNRCVILGVDDEAYHGYGPLRTPPGITRKALAVYYYSKSPDAKQAASPHATSWPALGGEHRVEAFLHRVRRGLFMRISRALRIRS